MEALVTDAQNVVKIRSAGQAKRRSGTGTFARLPSAAVYDSRISPHALQVLAAICVHVDPQGVAWPAVTTLAKRLGKARSTIQYHVRKLEEIGYVEIHRRSNGLGASRSNLYIVKYPVDSHSSVAPAKVASVLDDKPVAIADAGG